MKTEKIKSVLDSCVNEDQVKSVLEWSTRILDEEEFNEICPIIMGRLIAFSRITLGLVKGFPNAR